MPAAVAASTSLTLSVKKHPPTSLNTRNLADRPVTPKLCLQSRIHSVKVPAQVSSQVWRISIGVLKEQLLRKNRAGGVDVDFEILFTSPEVETRDDFGIYRRFYGAGLVGLEPEVTLVTG